MKITPLPIPTNAFSANKTLLRAKAFRITVLHASVAHLNTYACDFQVFHPTAKMLVELSKSQDIEAGDGTTSVCVIAGALLNACTDLLAKGIHPMAVAESFLAAADKAEEVLEGMSTPVDLANRWVLAWVR